MKLNLLFFVLPILMISCDQHKGDDALRQKRIQELDKMKWLEGTWKGKVDSVNFFYESWKRKNDTVYLNYGIHIQGSDTILSESTPLGIHKGIIMLSTEDSSGWHLTDVSEDEINLSINDPKVINLITWRHTKDDRWIATLKTKDKTVNYELSKVPELDRWVDKKLKK